MSKEVRVEREARPGGPAVIRQSLRNFIAANVVGALRARVGHDHDPTGMVRVLSQPILEIGCRRDFQAFEFEDLQADLLHR